MELLFQIIKFGLTGMLGMAIDFGLTWIVKEKLRFNKYLANGIGFCAAVTSNYLINRIWTFHSANIHWGIEFSKFMVVSLIGLCLNMAIVFVLHQREGGINFYFAKFLAIGMVFIWNFTANLFFTFV